MSGVFSHAIRYEFADRNPITAGPAIWQARERSSSTRSSGTPSSVHELDLREREMIVCDALTVMRRSELMGLQWCDLDFFEMRINIVRSVVDQAVGTCKTEASRKPVVMDEQHCASAHGMAAGKHVHSFHRLGLGFTTEEGAAAALACHSDALLHPAGSTTGRYRQENRLAHLPAYVLDSDQVAGRGREGCSGTPAACVFQNNDGWLHASFGST